MQSFTRHLIAVFCDDVRQEVNGKTTLIGVYNNFCVVDSFPAMLPSLSVMLRFVSPASQPIRRLGFKAWLGDALIAEIPVQDILSGPDNEPLAQRANEALAVKPADIKETGKSLSTVVFLKFQPLHVAQPCTLRVRAIGEDGEEYPAPGLAFIERFEAPEV